MQKTQITRELLEDITNAVHDQNGKEYGNPIPFQPTGIRPKEESLRNRIQRIIRTQLSEQMEAQGQETFQEANDFDVNDPFDKEYNSSKYELMTDEYPEDHLNPDLNTKSDAEEGDPDEVAPDEDPKPEE